MQSLSHSPQSTSTWRSENFPLFPAFLGILHLIKGLTWEHILGRCSVERLSKHPISLGIIKCFIMLPWKPVIIQFQTGMSCFENTWHQPHKGEGALDWNLWRLMPNVPVQSCRYAVCISVGWADRGGRSFSEQSEEQGVNNARLYHVSTRGEPGHVKL